jgi:hypothetical protein
MRPEQRPLSAVPRWILGLLAVALAAQLAWQATQRPSAPTADDLPPAPRPAALRLASLGEPAAMARLSMLYLQAFDSGGTNAVAYRSLDYERLIEWLRTILSVDPRSEYPLFAAARVYAEVSDPARSRRVLEFVYEEFFKEPNRRWQWLSHAALLAKHRLGDLALARRYAAAVERHTTDPNVPLWAKQMEIFILEDMGELEAARIMLGGLVLSGKITDPAEARYLTQRLEALEKRFQEQQK